MWYHLHHQCPWSRGWWRWNWNLLKLADTRHINYHRIFQNDTVNEAIIKILEEFNSTALTNDFRNDMMKILQENDMDYYYKEWIITNRDLIIK